MNLYWFSDEDGSYWCTVAAHDENQAWQQLAACSPSNKEYDPEFGIDRNMDEAEARDYYVLNAVTCIDNISVGEVVSIFPHEVGFTIYDKPGSGKISALANY